jgi:hypothetical protein
VVEQPTVKAKIPNVRANLAVVALIDFTYMTDIENIHLSFQKNLICQCQ